MTQDIEFQKILKRVENAFTQNAGPNLGLDLKLIKAAIIDVLTEITTKTYIQKSLDKKPTITYQGRAFKIENTNGLWHGTKVAINGVEQLKVKSLILKILPGKFVTVEMEVLDIV